jgi:formylglycine-generating enzyme required for sulfatase activity
MKQLLVMVLLAALIGCSSTTQVTQTTTQVKSETVKAVKKIDSGTIETFNGIDFVYIPAGSFIMGSDSTRENEKPAHKVTITKGFWLGKYEVTQEQWEKVMGKNSSYFRGVNFPIEHVTWDEIQSFITKLNDKKYRLPTEAEWEYACRAGSTTKYYFGEDDKKLEKHCWFGDDNESGTTHPVGYKNPNRWGLYDVYGNVWEVCQDYFGFEYYTQSPEENPKGPAEGKSRIIRGGCWSCSDKTCNSTYRNFTSPNLPLNVIGFRLLREE